MTIQVRYSHIRCSHVLKHKIMTGEGRQQGPAEPVAPTKLPSFQVRPQGRCPLTQLLGIAFFFMFIFSKHEPSKSRSLLALGDGDCSKLNFHLKKKRQKHDLKHRKSDNLVVRFRVKINKSSFLRCSA